MRWVVIGAGGAIGALARAGISAAVPRADAAAFPTGTLVINASGSFLLGVLVAIAAQRAVPASLVPALGTGVLGAYTTFSTFAVESIDLARAGSPGRAAAYVAASLIAGLAAALAGLQVGAAMSR
jgi:fluoride exporter